MALKLAPGGKALMVLLGLGLIGYGLWLGGLIGGVGSEEPGAGPEGAADVRPPAGAEAAAPVPDADGTEAEASDRPAEGEGVAAAEEGPEGAQPAEAEPPPPLLAEAPNPLRTGPDAWWDAPSDPRTMIRDLADGKVDIIAVELHHLVEHGIFAQQLTVIGALPPARPLALCADANPVETLKPGSRVAVGERSHQLLAAHVAEVKGIGASVIEYVPLEDPAADVHILDHIPEEKVCFSLAGMGAQGPRIILGRLEDVRLYGKSYLDAVRARDGLEAPARSYLAGSADDMRGYTRHMSYLAGLWSRITGLSATPAPIVARWVVEQAP
jgi:hypothetical protein